MVILELAVQGIRGLAPSVRIAFKQGYTLLQAQQKGGSIWRLVEALCYADGRTDTSALIAPGASQARAGLTFQGRDGVTYRLVRELGGQGTLARMDAGTGKFVPITNDGGEIAQYLRATLGLPTRGAYEQAFSILSGGWPSQRSAGPASPSAKPGVNAVRGLGNDAVTLTPRTAQPVADVAAARITLDELRKELEGTKEIDDLQYRLDGVQKRVYELGTQVNKLDQLRAQAQQAETALQSAPSPEQLGLPANVAERAARMETLEKQRDDQLRRLKAEREKFLGRDSSVPPLYKEPPFMGAMAAGALTLGLGVTLGQGWRPLSLLDIPAFGIAAVCAVRWVGEVQANESLGRRKSHYDDREKQICDAYENEVMSVKTAMKILEVGSPGELIDLFAQRQVLQRQLEDATSQLATLENDPTLAEAQRELIQTQAEQTQIDARLSQLAGYARPTHVVEGEIETLQASIVAAERGTSSPTERSVDLAPAAKPVEPAPAEDPIPKLLDSTRDLFVTDLPTLVMLVVPRASQYAAALTERRVSTLEVDAAGKATAVGANGKVPLGKLSPQDRDLVYLAVKVALMEKYTERAKLPYFVDDDFAQFSANQVVLIGRVLKHLGTRAQVVHLTTSKATEALADSRAAV
jgi:hypothetical protein